MTFPKRVLSLAVALTALSSIASGYYHFIYFPSRTGQFNPIPLQFDLTTLTNNTVSFFVSDQQPNVLVPGDSFTAILSELQLAAQAWNGVSSSQLKLAYGGLESSSTQQSAPGIDVVFDDDNIAVGILAQTKVTTYANVSFINSSTRFLPILRSRIQLRKNLTATNPQQASFYDSTFTTMVHELGHAVGLQHTLTSAAMSTYTTRSTTKAMPLAPDDIAGVSLLYPTPGFLASTGSIVGQVTLGGGGINLASVVALSPTTGAAISSLTNPDGSYRIDGIPPGDYLVYVHPLPPSAQGEFGPDAIVLPLDPSQGTFPAYTGFVTQFYPGTRDWTQAMQNGLVTVAAAAAVPSINFNVQGSAGPVVYGMQLSGYVNSTTPQFSPMLPVSGGYTMVFYAPGTTTTNNQLVAGLNVSVIGSPAANVLPSYTKFFENYNGYNYVSLGVQTSSVSSTTPVALAVTVNNDLYVLPAAFYVVPSGAPTISNLNPGTDSNGNGTLTLSGTGLSSATRFVFDGAVANLLSTNADGSYTLAAPPAPGNYSSSIEALNPDGQTSGQANPFSLPQQYFYNYVNPATITLNVPSVSPGTDTMIQIYGNNTNFNNQTTVGFGTSDIVVKQVFVITSNFLQVNVSVNSSAPTTASTVTVTTGLQTATTSLGIQITPSNPGQISLHAPVINAVTLLAGVPSGGTALVSASGLPQNLVGWTINIGGQTAPVFLSGQQQLTFTVAGGLNPGAATVQLISPTGTIVPPIAMKVDAAPPQIVSVTNAAGAPVTANQPAHPGDILTINVFGLSDGSPLTSPNLFASVGGITGGLNGQSAVGLAILPSTANAVQVQLPQTIPTGPQSLYVGLGTRASSSFVLNIS